MATASLGEMALVRCIRPLTEPLPLDRCGGKAWHLRRMLELRLPVPNGLVVTREAFDAFLESNRLRGPIASLLDGIEAGSSASQLSAADGIQNLISQSTVPAEVLDLLSASLHQLAPGLVAVRSSAIGEDSAQHSYAGQLDSVLNVDRELEAIGAALKRCWASYWSHRVIAYQRSCGIRLQGMAVIIQEQVPAELSGVLFTRHPAATQDPSRRDWMLVEYCRGLGESLVSGRVSPGCMEVSRSTRELRAEALPEHASDGTAHGLLGEVRALMLAHCGLALEEEFGGPQDIEWSFDGSGQLFLLQSRPITPSATGPPRPTKDDAPLVVWSNANVNENFPDPISPLLYSIASLGYYHYFRNLGVALGISQRRIEAMEQPLRNLVGVHGARLYYNLSNIHAVLRMAPFGELLADSFNQFVGSRNTQPSGGRLTWKGFSPGRFGQWLEVSRISACSLWQFLFVASRVRTFERTVDEFAAATTPDALENELQENLLGHLRRFLQIRCQHWIGASLADASAMLSYGLLKRMLEAEFPDDKNAATHNSLLRGLRDVVSSTPAARLWELSREIRVNPELHELFAHESDEVVLRQMAEREQFAPFWAAFRRYLDEWGFRCSGELMLTVPSYQERPAGLIEVLRAYAALEGESPAERLGRQKAERELETNRMYATLRRRWWAWFLPWPRKAFVFARLLRATQRAIVLRERARLKQALLYSRLRRIVLAIGKRLVAGGRIKQPDDVFYLTAPELDALLSGQSMFPAQTAELVALRRSAHNQLSRQHPPDTFAIPAGTYWRSDEPVAAPRVVPEDGQGICLKGSGVCGGVATAPAAVLESVTELHKLTTGNILITRQTDPGWAPVFPLIQGLVMERGGMLSHGAILAREYGLPTVVGIPDATRRIPSGQMITVNGDKGLVEFS